MIQLSSEAKPIRVLAIAGSLRKSSPDKALVRAAIHVARAWWSFGELSGIPLFDEDIEKQPPDAVRALKARVAAADALLIATPEYDNSIPES